MVSHALPKIIQGGMGAAVSSWELAQAVARCGQLGVVSGTALEVVLARRLQLGDPTGEIREALAAFPFPEVSRRILDRYFVPGGKGIEDAFLPCPMPSAELPRQYCELVVVANFVEVHLAKRGHFGLVGINYLEKIQVPTLPAIYGAMLADVDVVLMGAGIPRTIPGILDQLAAGQPVELDLDVQNALSDERFGTRFDPTDFAAGALPPIKRPDFLAIVSSATLATMLRRKSTGRVDGFVVELHTAGGHNAPPRGALSLNEFGEPVYGLRDLPDWEAFRALGCPFWIAGQWGTPQRLQEALELGAAGIQVGTAFALCQESGLRDDLKREIIELSLAGEVSIKTDPVASPTGFPFKVVQLADTLSDPQVFRQRPRTCDLGFLRKGYRRDDGTLGWRCPAEDVDAFVAKGGNPDDTCGRMCLCNALMANVGLGQQRNGWPELPLVTCGDAVASLPELLEAAGGSAYTASDVIDYLLSRVRCQIGA